MDILLLQGHMWHMLCTGNTLASFYPMANTVRNSYLPLPFSCLTLNQFRYATTIVNLTMVLMAAQMTTFYEDDEQIGIPHTMVIQLQTEGITTVGALADFEKDSLQQLADNLHYQEEGSLPQAPMLPLEQLFQCLPLPLVLNPRRGFLWLVTLSDTTIQQGET